MKQLAGLIMKKSLISLVIIVAAVLVAGCGAEEAPLAETGGGSADGAPVTLSAQLAELERVIRERGLTYDEQLTALQTMLQERRQDYQTEIDTANTQLESYQTLINQYQTEEQMLNEQINQLEQTQAERQITYQVQLQQTQIQYENRSAELQAQIANTRNALAEANAQLGH